MNHSQAKTTHTQADIQSISRNRKSRAYIQTQPHARTHACTHAGRLTKFAPHGKAHAHHTQKLIENCHAQGNNIRARKRMHTLGRADTIRQHQKSKTSTRRHPAQTNQAMNAIKNETIQCTNQKHENTPMLANNNNTYHPDAQ